MHNLNKLHLICITMNCTENLHLMHIFMQNVAYAKMGSRDRHDKMVKTKYISTPFSRWKIQRKPVLSGVNGMSADSCTYVDPVEMIYIRQKYHLFI